MSKDAEYRSGRAEQIRDARFAKSNQLNRDFALRRQREDVISRAYWNAKIGSGMGGGECGGMGGVV